MRCHVALTPAEAPRAQLGIVVDVVRATSTIAQALASGYRRVLCCAEVGEARALRGAVPDVVVGGERDARRVRCWAEVEQARTLRASPPDVVVGGERDAVRIEGFDVGASPREFLEPLAETLVLSTTNGPRAILTAAERGGGGGEIGR